MNKNTSLLLIILITITNILAIAAARHELNKTSTAAQLLASIIQTVDEKPSPMGVQPAITTGGPKIFFLKDNQVVS